MDLVVLYSYRFRFCIFHGGNGEYIHAYRLTGKREELLVCMYTSRRLSQVRDGLRRSLCPEDRRTLERGPILFSRPRPKEMDNRTDTTGPKSTSFVLDEIHLIYLSLNNILKSIESPSDLSTSSSGIWFEGVY